MKSVKRNFFTRLFFRIYASISVVREKTRILFFKALGAHIGSNVRLGNVQITVPEQTTINKNCVIEDNVRFRVGGAWMKSSISIDEDTFIGHSTQINVGGIFRMGKQCMVAPMCVFSDAHHSFDDINTPMKYQKCTYTPIEVEDNVWIGTGVKILGGVTIGTGAVIASGAVVNKSVPPYEVWGGVPAKKLKSRK